MVGSYLRSDKRQEKRARQVKEALEREEQAQCGGKHPYTSYREAQKIANYGCDDPGRKLGVYKCSICNAYHIGAHARIFPPDQMFKEARVKNMDELLRESEQDADDDMCSAA